ncbi:DUF4150 domain-containing protein [Desulfoluna sp.]|uniref:DUF4150 domain-containing protein n=1 Tax=Desulfoluna sp. TaxID=2045199 RepID=UPI00261CB0E6|nr:DUF4150 domain-containing protein [Desulfoluna sp.]
MAPTVTVNGLTLCHQGSGGIATSTLPDICSTPTPGGPVDVAYVNIAMDKDLAGGSVTVTADGGNPIAIDGCTFSKSVGDEPGSNGGVSSGVNLGEASFISCSPDVTIEGKAACRLSDKMMMNKANSACMGGIVIPPVVAPEAVTANERNEDKWLKIKLLDEEGEPLPNARYVIFKKDGTKFFEGNLDEDGFAEINSDVYMNMYTIEFPDLAGKINNN